MTNNDILRSLRYLLQANNRKLAEISALDGCVVSEQEMQIYCLKEEEAGYQRCSDQVLGHFLNGMIVLKRGRSDEHPVPEVVLPLTNNEVMKKVRVAFELKDSDVMEIFQSMDFRISKPEVSALFRRVGSKNYRPCLDQMLRYFLRGLIKRTHEAK